VVKRAGSDDDGVIKERTAKSERGMVIDDDDEADGR